MTATCITEQNSFQVCLAVYNPTYKHKFSHIYGYKKYYDILKHHFEKCKRLQNWPKTCVFFSCDDTARYPLAPLRRLLLWMFVWRRSWGLKRDAKMLLSLGMLMLSATQIYTIFTVQLFAFLNLLPVEADISAVSRQKYN